MPTEKRQRQKEGRLLRLEAERKAARRSASRRRFLTGAVIGLVVVAALLAVSYFGGDDDEPEAASTSSTSNTSTTTAGELDRLEKPAVDVPEGEPPAELQTNDLVVGEGEEATRGSSVTMDYVGVTYSGGEEFDASYERDPLTFTLGFDNIIEGWHQGIEGMHVGGRRQLVIPPDLAYGAEGRPPTIGPDETLVFIVDLLAVTPPVEPVDPAETTIPAE